MSRRLTSLYRQGASLKGTDRLDLAAIALGLLLLGFYLYNLTGWRMYGDEGEYLYQTWRMTLGEVPYRDFMTPQLPVFLYSGMAIMEIAGPSLEAMRLFAVLLSFGAAIILFVAGNEHKNKFAGLLAMTIYLLHPEVFKATRIFRNEALFLFLVTFGLVTAYWPTERFTRRRLALAGFCFGLATMVKLFGLLPALGVGLWLAWRWWHDKPPIRDIAADAMALTIPLLALIILIATLFTTIEPQFLNLAVGHHVSQGSGQTIVDILQDKIALYVDYIASNLLLVILAIFSAILGARQRDTRRRWGLQLITVVAFLPLSRTLDQRHFLYLLPSLSILVGWALADGLSGRYRRPGRIVTGLILLTLFIPWLVKDLERVQWTDIRTTEVVSLIKEHVDPQESVITDDIGLAFYSQRPTTYSGAAISAGAASSGQITSELLKEEIIKDNVQLVIADESLIFNGHLINLRDYPLFRRFLARNFDNIAKMQRSGELLSIWLRRGESKWQVDDTLQVHHLDGTSFGQTMSLYGYSYETESVKQGETLNLTLFWEATEPAEFSWKVFVHLVDLGGDLIAQDDKYPYDGLFQTDRWLPGLIVDDQYSIPIPTNATPAEYRLAIGMYDEATGERLLLATKDERPIVDNRYFLKDKIIVRETN